MTTTRPLATTRSLPALDLLTIDEHTPICTGAMYSEAAGFTQVLRCATCDHEETITAAHLQAHTPDPVTPLPIPDISSQLTEHIGAVSHAFLRGKALLRIIEMTRFLPSQLSDEVRASIESFESAVAHFKALKDLLGVEGGPEDHETRVLRAVEVER